MQEALGLYARPARAVDDVRAQLRDRAARANAGFGDRIRSVIVPWPGITDGELDILTKAGVVGYRITWRLTKKIDQKMVARTPERGWSMHYLHHADEAQMDGWKPLILKTPASSCWSTWAASIRPRASTATASSSCCTVSTPAAAG